MKETHMGGGILPKIADLLRKTRPSLRAILFLQYLFVIVHKVPTCEQLIHKRNPRWRPILPKKSARMKTMLQKNHVALFEIDTPILLNFQNGIGFEFVGGSLRMLHKITDIELIFNRNWLFIFV